MGGRGVRRPRRGRAPVDRPHQGEPVHPAQGRRARLRLRGRDGAAARGELRRGLARRARRRGGRAGSRPPPPSPTAATARSARPARRGTRRSRPAAWSAYCVAPTKPWQASSTQTAVSALRVCSSASRARSRNQTPTAAEPEQRRQRAVLVDRPVERVGAAPVAAARPVAGALAAGVRAGGGGDRPGASVSAPGHEQRRAPPRSTAGRSSAAARPARTSPARRARRAATSSAIESRKCPITQPGASP